MKNKYLLFCLIFVILLVAFFIFNTTENYSETKLQSLSKKNKNIPQTVRHINQENEIDLAIITKTKKPSKEIIDFNHYLVNNIDYQGFGTSENLLSNLQGVIQEHNVDKVAEALKNMIQSPEENLSSIRELDIFCSALKKRENNTLNLPKGKSTSYRGEIFLLALQKSGICSHYLTEKDPFYIALNMARKGNKLAQLFLVEDFGRAIDRGLITPHLHPLKYHDLKEEILGYLINLSSRGVPQATIMLKNLYSSNRFLVPQDDVLHFFYAYLAEKQKNSRKLFLKNSDELYSRLNENEKILADKMIQKLKL